MDYTISNGKFSLTTAGLGAEMKSFKTAEGKEYIWSSDPKHWFRRAPHLFPTVCSLKDGKLTLDDKTYEMEKHGFAKGMEFSLVSKDETEITLVLKANEKTLSCYPYNFEFYVTHKIIDSGCETIYKVKNLDNKLMYYAVGGHPGFNCPMNEDEEFSDYDIEFEKTETNNVYQSTPDDLGGLLHKEGINSKFMNINSFSLNYDIFKLDALVFEKINSKWVKLINRNTGSGILFEFEGFNSLGIWTPNVGGAPFICLEPWTAIPDKDDATGIFSEKPYITALEANGEKIYSYKMSIID